MCKLGTATSSEDKQEKVETSNYGLLNLSSSSMATPDLGEILLIVLLIVVGLLILWYVCKKRRQRRLQDLREAVAYRPEGGTISYPHRRILPIEFAGSGTTWQPSVYTSAAPSAPAPTHPGLWEQCP